MIDSGYYRAVLRASERLSDAVDALDFEPPVTHTYNPLRYAWSGHLRYLERFACSRKKILFMGMNPGPFGMAQTGVPFGEIKIVQEWMGIEENISEPEITHPKRPVEGFACKRSEVSGSRFWGLFAEHFPVASDFFTDHFVSNYCPLVFMEASGSNRTPDKLTATEISKLYSVCDQYFCDLVDALQPDWVLGVGVFAEVRAKKALSKYNLNIGRILHPSPANPAANRGWAKQAENQLKNLDIW